MSTARAVPPGYVALSERGTEGALLRSLERPLRAALAGGSFYAYAEAHPSVRPLVGRGVAYAVPLPNAAADVVVRHSRHGGLFAPITGDRFLNRTRAPAELSIALMLAHRGVPTPEVLAYATYPAGPFWRRADVVTREVPRSRDLAATLRGADKKTRRAALAAAARLSARLTAAGACHPDLNLKNILLAVDARGALEAYVLDVDRVWFDEPGSRRITDANLHRLARSARKWRRVHGLEIDEADLLRIASTEPD